MSIRRFLCLGAGDGWHAQQLMAAARRRDCEIHLASYESLRAHVVGDGCVLCCDAGPIAAFDAILTRTMPPGSLEQITFRLATLHGIADGDAGSDPVPIVNPPRALELAIDKFATLARVATLGYPVPETIVVQSRTEAMDAFRQLGGDCIVKPIFGGEGRGVMRICDAELAWYTFSTLQQLDAVFYVQSFVPPGGRDTRIMVVGDHVIGIRRTNRSDFRTNRASGAEAQLAELHPEQIEMARRICDSIQLSFATVDLVDSDQDQAKVIEVNSIPGWKGSQRVTEINIADCVVDLLVSRAPHSVGARCR